MKIEEIFPGIENLQEEYEKLVLEREFIKPLEAKILEMEKIREALKGLQETKRRIDEDNARKAKLKGQYDPIAYDPGKNDDAYFFVQRLTDNDIIAREEFEPALYEACSCGRQLPVLMWYTQTEDSPYGDTLAKQAFTICIDCVKINNIKSTARSHRFLSFE